MLVLYGVHRDSEYSLANTGSAEYWWMETSMASFVEIAAESLLPSGIFFYITLASLMARATHVYAAREMIPRIFCNNA